MSTCPACGQQATQEHVRDQGANGHQLVAACAAGHLWVTEWETKR